MDIKGFHLELTNICTLKCPACARTQFIKKFPSKWKNNSINLDDLKKFLDIDLNEVTFVLEGNYGDSIYYNNLFELCEWLKNKGAYIEIITNGSYKNKEWWEKLSSILTSEDTICWSIDGLPTNFTNYRINADWKSIKDGINIITKTNIKTTWKYIVFKFNQNDIEEAQELSKKLNIEKFDVVYSDRWDDVDNLFVPDNAYVKNTISKNIFKNKDILNSVDPKCLNYGTSHFISADGHYTPCCWTAEHNFYYKTTWGKNKKSYRISENTITSLLKRDDVVEFYDGLKTNNYPNVCSFNCGTCKN